MSNQPPVSPFVEFLQALESEGISAILIGMMAAVEQGAPCSTIDYDFWVDLPKRQVVRIYAIVQKLGGTLRAPTFYELRDGTQINEVFKPVGLRSFPAEFQASRISVIENHKMRVLPLSRVIASKRAAGRDKVISVLPVLERTLRLSKKLNKPMKKTR
ncbi:MAG: hypothetical protein WCS31_01020 [Verrucomicrobiae bacterium]